jgi:hypothetical protein
VNRAQLIELNLAAKRVAATTQQMLNDRAAAEFADEGVAPSWKSGDFNAVANMSRGGPYVSDADALQAWVAVNYPTEIETLVRIRPAFVSALVDRAAKAGAEDQLPLDADGERIIPGMSWSAGGQFSHMSVTAKAPLKARLDELATAVLGGHLPMALPSSFHPDAADDPLAHGAAPWAPTDPDVTA